MDKVSSIKGSSQIVQQDKIDSSRKSEAKTTDKSESSARVFISEQAKKLNEQSAANDAKRLEEAKSQQRTDERNAFNRSSASNKAAIESYSKVFSM